MIQDGTAAVFEALFDRTDREEYDSLTAPSAWAAFVADLEAAGAPHDATSALAAPPTFEAYSSYANTVLTPGIPGSVLPVESLYKPWSEVPGNAIGRATGFYLGDHARHVQALYESLGIEIPPSYAAMPDHLSLLLELWMLLIENGRGGDASTFARDHLDWLDAYAHALEERESLEENETLASTIRFFVNLTDVLDAVIESQLKEGDEIGNE